MSTGTSGNFFKRIGRFLMSIGTSGNFFKRIGRFLMSIGTSGDFGLKTLLCLPVKIDITFPLTTNLIQVNNFTKKGSTDVEK